MTSVSSLWVRVEAMVKGKVDSAIKDRLPTRDEVACIIMYISGSTGAFFAYDKFTIANTSLGPPEGVLSTHLSCISACGFVSHHNICYHLYPEDYFLSFLSLSHILAYIDLILFYYGCMISYGRVCTSLTNPFYEAKAPSANSVQQSWSVFPPSGK